MSLYLPDPHSLRGLALVADISRLINEIYEILPLQLDTMSLTGLIGPVGWSDDVAKSLTDAPDQPVVSMIKTFKKSKSNGSSMFVSCALEWVERCVSSDTNNGDTQIPLRPITIILFLICLHIYEYRSEALEKYELYVSLNSLYGHLRMLAAEFNIVSIEEVPGLNQVVF